MFATNASIGNVLAYNSITIKESRNLQKNAVPAEVRGRHTRITNLQSQKLQEQASANPAVVCAVVRVQRVVSGKDLAQASCHAACTVQGTAQDILQVHTGSKPDGIPGLTCILHRTCMNLGQSKNCLHMQCISLDVVMAGHYLRWIGHHAKL